MFTTGIYPRIGARFQTSLLILDSRSEEPKIDNVIPDAMASRPTVGAWTPVVRRRKDILKPRERGHEHELTSPRIASREHRFRIDQFSAVVARRDTTRGACCWTPDATLAERARLGDICWPEYLAMEALPHCAAMKIVAPLYKLILVISNKEPLPESKIIKELLAVTGTETP